MTDTPPSCQNCGQTMTRGAREGYVKFNARKYCSEPCRIKARKLQARPPQLKTGGGGYSPVKAAERIDTIRTLLQAGESLDQIAVAVGVGRKDSVSRWLYNHNENELASLFGRKHQMSTRPPAAVATVQDHKCALPTCDNQIPRRSYESERAWLKRTFCSITCSNLGRPNARSRVTLTTELPDLPKAECVNHNPELFHYTSDQTQAEKHKIAYAVSICNGCSEKTSCLIWALEHNETGIWGATTEAQRISLKRRAQRQQAA